MGEADLGGNGGNAVTEVGVTGVAVAGDPADDAVPKPVCRLSGANGNVFNVIALVREALRGAGQDARASEFVRRAFAALSYDEVLAMCHEYVDFN